MSAILDNGVTITRYIKVTPQQTQGKIVSTLLDGTEHVQIIGSPVERLDIELAVEIEGRNVINNCEACGQLIQVEDEEGNLYLGRIIRKDPWQKIIRGWFKTNITVSVEVV